MKLLVRPFMTPDLQPWADAPFTPGVEAGPGPGDARDCDERVVAQEAPGPPRPGGPFRRVAAAILAFDVFPPTLITGVLTRPRVEVGDAVGVCYYALPGLDLFFAARVTAVFDEARDGVWRCGFTYRTLRGHPECGDETFSVEKDLTTGRVVAALRSWSRPGLWYVRLGRPLMRQLQRRAARAALDHLEAIAHSEAETPRPRHLRTRLLCGAGEW